MSNIIVGLLVISVLFALCLAGDRVLETERKFWIEYRNIPKPTKDT